jgi:hypothetical protein
MTNSAIASALVAHVWNQSMSLFQVMFSVVVYIIMTWCDMDLGRPTRNLITSGNQGRRKKIAQQMNVHQSIAQVYLLFLGLVA